MVRIRLRGIPLRYKAGTVIQEAAEGSAEPVTFLVAEDGFGYAEVSAERARDLTERCAEIEIAEGPGPE